MEEVEDMETEMKVTYGNPLPLPPPSPSPRRPTPWTGRIMVLPSSFFHSHILPPQYLKAEALSVHGLAIWEHTKAEETAATDLAIFQVSTAAM